MTWIGDHARAQGWSVAALARELGVARPGLSEALSGARTASRWYWMDVGHVLGLSNDELFAMLGGNERGTAGGGTRAGSYRAR